MFLNDLAARSPRPAILFDVDGTLVDSNAAHSESWSLAAADHGYDRPATFFRPLMGMGGDRVLPLIADGLTDASGIGAAIAKGRGENFKSRFLDGLRPTDGARELVEAMHRAGFLIVLATSAKPDELQPLLRLIGIEGLIDATATSDDVTSSKPSPEIVIAALRAANVEPSDACLLGDAKYDIEAAAATGVPTIAVRCGGSSDADLRGAREIYDDPRAVLERFLRDGTSKEPAASTEESGAWNP